MKRNWLKSLGLVLVSVLLCGCYTYKVDTTVNKDKSMNFKMEMGIDLSDYKELLGDDYDMEEAADEGGLLSKDDQEELKKKGYEVDVKTEDYKTTITVTKKFSNIDDLSKDKEFDVDMGKFGEEDFDEKFFSKSGNGYKANLVFDFTDMDMSDTDTSGVSADELKDAIKVEYRLNLPVKATKNNATKEENNGKTLIWELELGKKNVVNYEFNLEGGSSVPVVVIIVLAVVVCDGVAVFFVNKNKKTN